MKKLLMPIFSLMLLTSCIAAWESGISYYGVWRSDYPEITMFLLPEYRISKSPHTIYPGIYVKDGVETDIFIWIFPTTASLSIYTDLDDVGYFSRVYLSGKYSFRRFHRDKIYLQSLPPHWQELTGIDRIVFELAESVEAG